VEGWYSACKEVGVEEERNDQEKEKPHPIGQVLQFSKLIDGTSGLATPS
jgi:hypothetical protein